MLSDELGRGSPAKFSLEQIVEIVALACETPQDSERPVNQWTPTELVAEAFKKKQRGSSCWEHGGTTEVD